MLKQKLWLVGLVALLLMMGATTAVAQEVITATPARVVIPTQGAEVQQGQPGVTATWTRTPTVPGPALLEVREDAGEVNVRAEPDINSERIGSIRAGDTYVVLGRRFRWYQFQFDTSPNGRGWVFDELVEIIGDESTIVELDPAAQATVDPIIEAETQTQIAITTTPGGLLTATAQARILPAPGTVGAADASLLAGEGEDMPVVLPTFTYPAEVIAFAPTEPAAEDAPTATTSPSVLPIPLPEDVPPIAPVLILGGLGLLGLVLSSLRR